jgi:hypothetical protein
MLFLSRSVSVSRVSIFHLPNWINDKRAIVVLVIFFPDSRLTVTRSTCFNRLFMKLVDTLVVLRVKSEMKAAHPYIFVFRCDSERAFDFVVTRTSSAPSGEDVGDADDLLVAKGCEGRVVESTDFSVA